MTKDLLLKEISNRVEGATKQDIKVILEAFEDVVVDTLKSDINEKITFGKLGSFKGKEVPERRRTIMVGKRKGEEYVTPKHSEITFKMSRTGKLI
nr:MAG TPA: Bacterial DNA-binding protein [Caudoviricetes sp.]